MDSKTKPHSAMLEKILGPQAASALESEANEPIKDARPPIPTPMLDLVMKDGRIESFPYAYLTRVSFDPRGRLVLYFGDDTVVLEGRNLHDIRQKVRLHKANEIREGNEAEEALKPESAAHIERIELGKATEKEEEGHRYDAGRSKGFIRQ